MKNVRTKELQYLNQYYQKEGSHLLVVYGQEGIGKTTLLKEFVKGKAYRYYAARYASNEKQMKIFAEEMGMRQSEDVSSYLQVLNAVTDAETTMKKVLIIDEFHKILKQGNSFFSDIIAYIEQEEKQDVLMILCSSSVAFVENSLVRKVGRGALSIHGFYKIKELGFAEIVKMFDEYSTVECIEVYSVLGGVPRLLNCFDKKLSVRENIIKNILTKGSLLREEGSRQVAKELRETAVYHTILSELAEGHYKLNELHEKTGFSRAKISVYLKNLMELEFTDKIFSIDTKGRENTQKGIYQIKNHYVHFWFVFLWRNISELEILEPEEFYDRYIEPYLKQYVAYYFPKICTEYMEIKNLRGELPIQYVKSGRWVGKTGNIDLLAVDERQRKLACFCRYENPMSYEEYEQSLYQLKQAKVQADAIYLFSGNGFDKQLQAEADKNENLILVHQNDL